MSDLHPIRELVVDERKYNLPFPFPHELAGDYNPRMPGFHDTTCSRHSAPAVGKRKCSFVQDAMENPSLHAAVIKYINIPAIEDSHVLTAVLDESQELRRGNRSPW